MNSDHYKSFVINFFVFYPKNIMKDKTIKDDKILLMNEKN